MSGSLERHQCPIMKPTITFNKHEISGIPESPGAVLVMAHCECGVSIEISNWLSVDE